MTIEVRRRTWTVGDYHRMLQAGVLSEGDRVELIEGEIVEMSAMGDRHIRCINKLNALLVPPAAGRAMVQVQLPVRLSDISEPEPDLSLVRWQGEFTSLPTPEELLLVIEVSDTTLRYDQQVKVPLYAAAGVPECWVVDLEHGVVQVHRRPEDGRYQSVEAVAPGGEVVVPGLAEVTVDVADLLA